MKGLIATLKNIWSIEELRKRILLTLALIFIYRVGSFIVLPGVDPTALQKYASQSQEGLLGMINLFAGGAFSRASVFALGIMPYISASIVIQLMSFGVPYFQRLQKEGESGRQKINQITRILTIAITAVQAVGFLTNLQATAPGAMPFGEIWASQGLSEPMSWMTFFVMNTIILTSGTMFVMWLGEKITDKGIGNGISILIMIGIIAGFPQSIAAEFDLRVIDAAGGAVIFLVEMTALLLTILITVALVQGVRRIPIQRARQMVGRRQVMGTRQYLPIKVNSAGVMPIIFAQAIMFIPQTVSSFFADTAAAGVGYALTDFTSTTYNIVFAFFIIIFTYFYTAVTVQPKQMAEDLKRNGSFIPGVKPGKKTEEYLDAILSRITLPGSIFLAIIAIFPAIAVSFGVNTQFSFFFGGTSLLIMVGVILDTLQQIESHLLMRRYDGLVKDGRIKGRSGNAVVTQGAGGTVGGGI